LPVKYVLVSTAKVSTPVLLMKPAVAVVMKVARAVSAGPTLKLYVELVAVFALKPVPVPTVTVAPEAAAAPILRVSVPLFTVGISVVRATVPVEAGSVIVFVPAIEVGCRTIAPLVAPGKETLEIPVRARFADALDSDTDVVPIKCTSPVRATVPVVAGRVIVVAPATAEACSLVLPLVVPLKITPLEDPVVLTVIPPVAVIAVEVVAPRPVTVARVSLSAVRKVEFSKVQVSVPVLLKYPVPVNAAIALRSASSA